MLCYIRSNSIMVFSNKKVWTEMRLMQAKLASNNTNAENKTLHIFVLSLMIFHYVKKDDIKLKQRQYHRD